MERSYINQLIPGKQLGAMMHGEPQKGFTYAASLYQNGFNPVSGESQAGGMAAARLTANFAELNNMADKVVHFGFAATGGKYEVLPTTSGNTQSAASGDTRATILGFRSENRGLANSYRAQIGGDKLVAGSYNASANNAASVTQMMGGLELALATGPTKFQYEYAMTNRDATHPGVNYTSQTATTQTNPSIDVKAKTMYAEVMYNVTGESWADAYKGGAFSGIKPKSNFVYGTGGGAWQVGLRYSSYDASDTVVGSGAFTAGSPLSRVQNSAKANTVTLAANWILNPNARVMFNVSQTRFDTAVEALDTAQDSSTTRDETVISVRTQINF
jgi:phosphate-selective porin OprO/OprP